MAVVVCAHDANWPRRFEAERQRLAGVMGKAACRIEHVGSTSVPGLAAKPIIDVLVGVDSLDRLDARTPAIRSVGYQVKGEYGLPGRRYYRRAAADGTRLAHIHAYDVTSPEFHRHLAFRDYLRAHPEEANAYGEHKLTLAAGSSLDGQDYQAAKSAMVAGIEARALVWASRADQIA